ncbi:pyruvate, phosphate dikinase [Mycobacterium sp. NPDC051198]
MNITKTTMLPIYRFDHPHAVPARELAAVLGGKGAGLAEMTSALGLPVPPGFTVGVDVCSQYRRNGWPAGLNEAISAEVAVIGDSVGRKFGDHNDPLLVAVRSGAPRSMPGMLDTVLNLGINDDNVGGLAAVSHDEEFAWDTYRRFLRMFGATVLGAPPRILGEPGRNGLAVDELQVEVRRLQAVIEKETGTAVPSDPQEQLRQAVEAVFRSWDNPRAQAYRAREGVDESTGTAVNVQAMVFGNRGSNSGTGVVFTRNPSTGEDSPFGDFLPQAQGEDVVSGAARTQDITTIAQHDKRAYTELLGHLRRLEQHYRDICDVEFTYEQGRLWILQTRIGKRSAVAAVRAAVAMVTDPHIALTSAEAVARVPVEIRARARRDLQLSSGAAGTVLATGMAASPGQASGRAVLDAGAAAEAEDDVILVREETDPDDVHGMSVAKGILTMRGGLVSHAAVVARGWGIPAVVGADGLSIDGDSIVGSDGEVKFRAGDTITIDGSSGEVWLGGPVGSDDEVGTTADVLLPELNVLDAWAQAESSRIVPQLNSLFIDNPVHLLSPPTTAWTTVNMSEALPGVPTPLTWDLFERNCERGTRKAFQRIGLYTKDDLDDVDPFHRIFGSFHGRPAINVDRVRWIADRTPGASSDAQEELFFGRVRPGVAAHPTRRRYAAMALRAPAALLRLPREMDRAAENQQLWYERTLAELAQGRSARAIFVRAEQKLTSALELHALGTQASTVALASLTRACASVGLDGLQLEIGTAGGRLIERDLIDQLAATARGEQELSGFLARFGYNGPEAFELSAPSWRERPELVKAVLAHHGKAARHGDGGRSDAAQEAVVRLLSHGSRKQRNSAKLAVSMVRQFLPLREVGKAMFVQVFDVIRAAVRILGDELVYEGSLDSRDDALLLTACELLHTDPRALRSIAEVRAAQRAEYQHVELPRFWVGQPEPQSACDRQMTMATEGPITGVPASAGVAQGMVRVVLDPELDPFEPGEVLVCPTTDPGWVPHMSIAAAVVIDSGGAMSHGAIIARELGVPCVIGTDIGTKALSTGDVVRVDGGAGTVLRV